MTKETIIKSQIKNDLEELKQQIELPQEYLEQEMELILEKAKKYSLEDYFHQVLWQEDKIRELENNLGLGHL